MLLLSGQTDFEDGTGLKKALTAGLTDYFHLDPSRESVGVVGTLPALDTLHVNLDNARIELSHLPPPPGVHKSKGTCLSAGELELSARPLYVGRDASMQLHIHASQADLEVIHDGNRSRWLALDRARKGYAEFTISGDDIEKLFLSGAKLAAKEHGVTIEHGAVRLTQSREREVGIAIQVTAKKLFMKSHLAIQGRVYVDKELNAHFSNLSCTGKGPINAVVAHYVTPFLREWEQRTLPLLGLFFTGISLHDVGLKVDPKGNVRATAAFGE